MDRRGSDCGDVEGKGCSGMICAGRWCFVLVAGVGYFMLVAEVEYFVLVAGVREAYIVIVAGVFVFPVVVFQVYE